MIGAAWLLAAVQLAGLMEDLGACRHVEDQSARLACYDALAWAPPVPADAAAAGSKGDDAARIEAHLFGKQAGWRKGTRFALDNGQVWVCVDEREGFDELDGNAVTIARDRTGGYSMHVSRVAGDIQVRREQ